MTIAWSRLFEELSALEYQWQPLTPDDLLRFRKNPESFSTLLRYFGLGLSASTAELQRAGLSEDSARAVIRFENEYERPALSRVAQCFVLHSHWPAKPDAAAHHVHFGRESLQLLDFMNTFAAPKRLAIDLGASSGGLCLGLAEKWKESGLTFRAIELSPRAVAYGEAAVEAQGLAARIHFQALKIESNSRAPECQNADLIFFNPPMVQPEPGVALPHRDGGKMGIELPLLFLDFAHRHLRPEGEVLCLCTNPIVGGRGLFFEALRKLQHFQLLEKKLLNPFFNQSVARKRQHHQEAIEHIELWALHLRKR